MENSSKTVLVADDDEAIRGVVSEVLTDEGYAVITAKSGTEALELFKSAKCQLVITDIRMPGMSGIELLEAIRLLDHSAQVIIMTSHASMETSVKALKLGAYDYILKPFDSLISISNAVNHAADALDAHTERDRLMSSLRQKNTELEELNSVFRELAIRDGLTGLYNHRHFQSVVSTEVVRARQLGRDLSVIFIDVDHFKTFNDANGHPCGDSLLKDLAKILQSSVRPIDTVARWGGEEFVVLMPEANETHGFGQAEAIRECVAEHSFTGMQSQPLGFLTVSAGVATLSKSGVGQLMIQRADEALYRAKRSGRNAVVAFQEEAVEQGEQHAPSPVDELEERA